MRHDWGKIRTADDDYLDTRDFLDSIIPNLLEFDFRHYHYEVNHRDLFNKMCYLLELLDFGISMPYKLIYGVVEFLEFYLNGEIVSEHWTIPEDIVKAYTAVLKKLNALMAEEVGKDTEENRNRAKHYGWIRCEGFLKLVNQELEK